MQTLKQRRKAKYIKRQLNTFLIEVLIVIIFSFAIMINLDF